jgi:predicted nucleic acid-binding protein
MRKLIDANVVLRYLLGDHPQMSEEDRQIIEEGAFILPEVIAEVVYVLIGVYKIERDEVGRIL